MGGSAQAQEGGDCGSGPPPIPKEIVLLTRRIDLSTFSLSYPQINVDKSLFGSYPTRSLPAAKKRAYFSSTGAGNLNVGGPLLGRLKDAALRRSTASKGTKRPPRGVG
jgi:hypothetical protein